jgi:mono/diheme cytochrome c family protein
MRVKSRDLIFIAIIIVVVGGLAWLSTRNKAKAMRATTPEHLTARARGECFECHTKEKMEGMERQRKHPNKWSDETVECIVCHKPPPEAKALKLNTRQIREIASLMRRAN